MSDAFSPARRLSSASLASTPPPASLSPALPGIFGRGKKAKAAQARAEEMERLAHAMAEQLNDTKQALEEQRRVNRALAEQLKARE